MRLKLENLKHLVDDEELQRLSREQARMAGRSCGSALGTRAHRPQSSHSHL